MTLGANNAASAGTQAKVGRGGSRAGAGRKATVGGVMQVNAIFDAADAATILDIVTRDQKPAAQVVREIVRERLATERMERLGTKKGND